MSERIRLDQIAIVLHRPRYSENIGAAARAMRNMGLRDLVVVDSSNCDLSRVLKMATHEAIDIVEQIQFYDTLPAALAPFNFVVGTTARRGRRRQMIPSPAILADKLVAMSKNNRIALLFGPEDRGLTNEDIRCCNWLVNIPTADFSSLNLAQAVMIVCYELFLAGREDGVEHTPRMAQQHELEGMYEQIKDILVRINYINPENPDYWMTKIRHFFTRIQLRAKEVSIIRGICRQINWYSKKCYEDGRKGRKI